MVLSFVCFNPPALWSHVIWDVFLPYCFPLSVLLLPAAWYNNRTAVTKLRHASKKLLARIWPKRAVSQGSQKAILIAGLHHQNPKIWLQKAPGQDLAQKGRFLGIPEGNFNCRAPSHQNSKIWLQKAPSQDLAQKGRFLGIPEGNFSYRAPPPESQNLAPKGSWPGFAPKEPFPKDPRRQF